MKIGFLGGGNMAGAIIRGMVQGGVKASSVLCYDIDAQKTFALREECGITVCQTAEQLCEEAQALVLAVKPQAFEAVLSPLRAVLAVQRPLVISIAAGKTIESVEALIGTRLPTVRVMPNIAAKVGEAVTAYCSNDLVTQRHVETVYTIFESVGTVVPLSESQFGIFSVLASCSPAYTLLYMNALATAGVRGGIPKDTALQIVAQSVLGTAKLLLESGEHPSALIDSVCSPGGTTIEGVCALKEAGLEDAVLKAAAASLEKDKKLQNA